jgi:hypothetical protein
MAANLADVDLGVELPDDLYEVCGDVEDALDAGGPKGSTPSEVARRARTDSATARICLDWMVAHAYAHRDHRGAWSRFYPGRGW